MGVFKGIRSILSAATAIVALAATSAFAQTTLTVSVAPVDGGVIIGATNDYVVTITNTGAEDATGVQITAATFPAELELDSVDGCNAPNTALPCTLTASTIAPGASAEVTVSASGVIPSNATCPPAAGQATGDTTITAQAANSAAASGTAANVVMPYTDIQVDMSGAPANVDAGSTHTITTTVTNAGPCPVDAPDQVTLFLTWPWWFEPGDAYRVVSATGNCDVPAGETLTSVVDAGECVLGPMTVGQVEVVAATVQVPDPAGDLTNAVYDSFADVATDTLQDGDPLNNSAAVRSRFESSDANSSCSTGGAGALLSLIPLLAAGAWRRRKQA